MPTAKPLKVSSGSTEQFGSTDTVPSANLGTGTADGTTYLRGDGTWNTPAGGTDGPLPVRAATTVNITLSGTQTIDGVAVIATDKVLVKNQTTNAENGVYTVAAGAWSLTGGSYVGQFTALVSEGTVNGAGLFNNMTLLTPSGNGGSRQTATVVEVDFGTKPVVQQTFTISDVAVVSTNIIQPFPVSSAATGRVSGDSDWDQLLVSGQANTGSVTLSVMAVPGPVVGKRRIGYIVNV